MQIVDLSQNDDIRAVIEKCNLNFKQLVFFARQSIKKQGRQNDDNTEHMIIVAVNDLVTITIPSEVSYQINQSDIPGKISDEVAEQLPGKIQDAIDEADIPQLVEDEVTEQMPQAFPPVGSYIMMQSNPSSSYQGTTWQQTDSITTDTSVVIPIWERMS